MSGPKIGRAGTSYAQKPIQRLQGFFSEESELFPSHRNLDNDSVMLSSSSSLIMGILHMVRVVYMMESDFLLG